MKPDATTTPLPSLALRHGFSALAGFLITHGIATQADSSASIITGLVMLFIVTVSSWFAKLRWNFSPHFNRIIDDNGLQVIQKLVGAAVSQGLAAFSGYLATTPAGTFDVQNPEALTLFFANAAASRWKVHQLATGLPKKALVLAACLPLASCLSPASRDTLKSDLETALIDAGKAFTASSLRTTLKTLNAEREALETAPVPPTWQEQVVQQNKLAALKAAIQLAEERLAKLTTRSAKAVNEVNPVKVSGSKFQVSSFPLSAGRPASSATPHHANSSARATRARPAVPLYAPRIIAALRLLKPET